jgi:hypothetical protein
MLTLSAARRRSAAITAGLLTAGALAGAGLWPAAGAAAAASHPARPDHGARATALQARVILSGRQLRHSFPVPGARTARSARLTSPDDLATLGGALYTAFQNGVGPQGQAAPDGNQYSTVVEFSRTGRPLANAGSGGRIIRR